VPAGNYDIKQDPRTVRTATARRRAAARSRRLNEPVIVISAEAQATLQSVVRVLERPRPPATRAPFSTRPQEVKR